MLYPTHMLAGALAGTAFAAAIGASPWIPAAVAALGALVPDLDTPQAKGARALGPLAALAVAAGAWPGGYTHRDIVLVLLALLAGLTAPHLLHRLVGHRGVWHAPILHLGLGSGLALTAFLVTGGGSAALVIAYATSGAVIGGLALDACTVRGIPLLWPLHLRPVHLVPRRCRFVTGGQREQLLRVLLVVVLVGATHLAMQRVGTQTTKPSSRPGAQGPAAAAPPRPLRGVPSAPLMLAAGWAAEGACGGRGGRPPARTCPRGDQP